MTRVPAFFRALLADRSGSVAVEAAGVLTLLLLTMVGAVDASRFLQTSAKAERLASNIADMASRSDALRDRSAIDALTQPSDLGMFFQLAARMAQPLDLDRGGIAISSLSGGAARNTINWTRIDGDGISANAERLSALPAMPADTHFIVAEVILPFAPLILDGARFGVGLDREIYRRAVFRTRTASLTMLEAAP